MSHNRNPYKGNVINQPGGPNLYPGVAIDYRHMVRREVLLFVIVFV